MNCRELAELLIDFVAGELPPEHHKLIQDHLGACPPCVTYLETYQVTIRITRKLPCRPLPEAFKERLRKAMAEIQREDQ